VVNFYDKVAKRDGGYAFSINKPKYTTKYPNGEPEKIFLEKLLELAKTDKIVLDVGCGDCKFAFGISSSFKEIVGIDTSKELLKVASSKKKVLKITNVSFSLQDAEKTNFKDESFDIIFCRRGPTFFKEYYRLLKKGGYYLEIDIGEKDTVDIKKIFGRGQNYGEWVNSRLVKNSEELKKIGFKIIYAKDFDYSEYYSTYKELEIFLLGVPIFEDFDPEKDKKNLEEYCEKFNTEKGIALSRHRVVMVSRKA